MFKKVSQFLTKELDSSGEFQPLTSILESKCVDVLNLVKIMESTRFLFFKEVRYRPTSIKLEELLQSEDTVDCGRTQCDIGAMEMSDERKGSVRVKSDAVPFLGQAGVNCEVVSTESATEIKLEHVTVDRNKLDKTICNSKVDMDHYLIRELKKNRKIKGLAVICEVIKAKNPLTLVQLVKGVGGMNFSVLNAAAMESGATFDKTRNLKLEAGCVLGFKVHEMSTPRKFGAEGEPMMSDGVADIALACDFTSMKQQVTVELEELGNMDYSVKKMIWDVLSKTLKCPQALYALDCMLEEGCICTSSLPPLDEAPEILVKSIEELLQQLGLDSAEPSDPNALIKSLALLVNSLAELDEQAVTLIVGLEGKVRGQVLELVEEVLERGYSRDSGVPEWSQRFSENTVIVAKQVLTSCGLKWDEGGLAPSLWDLGVPTMTLLAIYITLKGINMLLEP